MTRTIAIGAAAAAMAYAPAAQADAPPRLEGLRALSGVSTFTGCALQAPPPFHANDFSPDDTAVEPRIVVDPNDPRRMAAAWMQDFASGILVATTSDGGHTWRTSMPPGVSQCAGGEGGAFDPGLAYGAEGNLYLSLMGNVVVRPGRTTPDNEIAVLTSRDNGATWDAAVTVQPRHGFNDYPTIAADPEVPGRVYVSWVWTTEPLGGNTMAGYLSISEDGGRTFSQPRTLFGTPRPFHWFIGHIAAAPGGRVAYVLTIGDNQNFLPLPVDEVADRIIGMNSGDGGRTWSEPATIGTARPEVDAQDPDSGDWAEPGTFGFTAGPDGTFWVLYPHRTEDEHRLMLSSASGDRWSEPRSVLRRDPGQILLPSIATALNGSVAFSWYDTSRDARGDERWDADAWMAVSRDEGESFEHLRLAGPMDLRGGYADGRTVDNTVVRTLGDYVGLAGTAKGFLAALPLTPPLAEVGRSQVFAAEVR